ncbi:MULTISPECIES: restriction endonuclease subunit S [unclassified Oceanobacillus]|uniref:restriction endonuclease subunit S n=1 Tax=unclassified Oceanobacillus TaxID=2630292 RepID=UPI00300E2ECC
MTFNDWKEVSLDEVILFNPRESLKKGTKAKKIGMDKLAEFQRKITGYEYAEFKSGTKFRNGDTLLARITPCLENGKTAQVDILDENEVGFGSTEFIVMREIPEKSHNDFIYYLSISDKLRNIAIKSMTGTSGRQRAQRDVLEKTKISIPPLDEQKAIANILSTLDEKIETNNQINEKLEEIAQALFQHWFVNFEFPNENGEPYKSSGGEMVESGLGLIPKGWNLGELGDIISISSGKRPKDKQDNFSNEHPFPIVGASSIMGYTSEFNYNEPVLIIGRVGTHGVIQTFTNKIWASDNTLVIKSKYYGFTYNILNSIDYKSLNRGSTQPLITQKDIKNTKILIPDNNLMNSYEKFYQGLFEKVKTNNEESELLGKVRDTLIPRLMTGEVRIPLNEE